MTWFLVAIMATMHPGGDVEVFMFTEPTFESVEQCLAYPQTNSQAIIRKLAEEFKGAPIQNLLCATEEQIKKAFEMEPKIST